MGRLPLVGQFRVHLFLIFVTRKVWSEIKETTFQVGHFTAISGHSIANYINIFHKTEVPTIILRCLMSLNLNWIKSYNINYKLFSYKNEKHSWQTFLTTVFFNFVRNKIPKRPFFWPFVVFFGNYIDIFHKTEIQKVILRYLVCLNLNWIKNYDIIIGWNKFFHAWKYRSKFLHLRRKTAVIFSIWLFFQNSLVMS